MSITPLFWVQNLDMEKAKAKFVTDQGRWIGQLNELYWRIVKKSDTEKLDEANEVICKAMEKLRPLTK